MSEPPITWFVSKVALRSLIIQRPRFRITRQLLMNKATKTQSHANTDFARDMIVTITSIAFFKNLAKRLCQHYVFWEFEKAQGWNFTCIYNINRTLSVYKPNHLRTGFLCSQGEGDKAGVCCLGNYLVQMIRLTALQKHRTTALSKKPDRIKMALLKAEIENEPKRQSNKVPITLSLFKKQPWILALEKLKYMSNRSIGINTASCLLMFKERLLTLNTICFVWIERTKSERNHLDPVTDTK